MVDKPEKDKTYHYTPSGSKDKLTVTVTKKPGKMIQALISVTTEDGKSFMVNRSDLSEI